MLITPAYAQDGAAAAGGGLGMFLPLILMFIIFYFFMIRPQQKRMKAHQAMLKAIKRNDIVVTSGGIVGKVRNAGSEENDELELEIAENVRVKFIRSAISTVRSKTEPTA